PEGTAPARVSVAVADGKETATCEPARPVTSKVGALVVPLEVRSPPQVPVPSGATSTVGVGGRRAGGARAPNWRTSSPASAVTVSVLRSAAVALAVSVAAEAAEASRCDAIARPGAVVRRIVFIYLPLPSVNCPGTC